MQARDIDSAWPTLLSAVPTPVRGSPRIARDTVILGFDTEYRPEDRALLSVQLAARDRDGRLVSRVAYPPAVSLTPEWLAGCVAEFLMSMDRLPTAVRGERRVVLVAHYAAAELGVFTDPLRDLVIRQIGKAHHAKLPVMTNNADEFKWSIRIVDLFAYYKTSLEQIGAMIGLPKIDEDREQLEKLLRSDRPRFELYAARDAEIAFVAFETLRRTVMEQWGVDVLLQPTLPSVAAAIFKHGFLKAPPAPTKLEPVSVHTKLKSGWQWRPQTLRVYGGSAEARLAACRSYWGGRVEAFVQGLVVGPVVERDVVSLYPSAALLQPLPNEKTRWVQVTTLDAVRHLEGYGHFSFSFLHDQHYPCLPVVREGVPRLCFTQRGESWCTFAEVRAAIDLGAKIEVLDAWGFEPGERERDHDLGRYVRHFMAEKKAATKGTVAYETSKLLMNALIGKLAERGQPSYLLEFERQARQYNAPGLGAAIARSHLLRGALKGAPRVGSLWIPEWAALILGRARAIMAPITAKGALLLSTDAVLVPPNLSLNCSGLEALKSVGSDLDAKVEGDAVFISRSRLYALLQRVDRVRPGVEVLARDSRWAVVRVARHGTPESKEEFAKTVLACLAASEDVAPMRTKTRLLSAESAVRDEAFVNEEVSQEGRTFFTWDGKRRLLDRDVNLFHSATQTRPYLSLEKMEAAEHQRELRGGTARRRRSQTPAELLDLALAMLNNGLGVRQVARETQIPKSTIADMKKRLDAERQGSGAAGPQQGPA